MKPLLRGHTIEAWRYVIIRGTKNTLPFAAAVLALMRYDVLAVILLGIAFPLSILVDLAFSAFIAEEVGR